MDIQVPTVTPVPKDMSRRDWFASFAMAGFLANGGNKTDAVKYAFQIADAMLIAAELPPVPMGKE